jgi:drug/metabolite transporter (DMT)-like permease
VSLAALPKASGRRAGLLFAALGAIAFSGKAIVAKLMYQLGADAVSTVGLRMTMALPLFLLMAWWSGREQTTSGLTSRQWWQLAGLGFTGYYLASTLDFLGLQYISASLERAILYLNPTLVLILSAWWLRQPVRPMQWLAVALAYSGVAVVWLHDWDAAQWVSASATHGLPMAQALTLGSLLVLGSALSYAVYLMGSGRLVQQLGSMRLVGYASVLACLFCVVQWVAVWAATQGQVGALAGLPWQAFALSAVNAVACTVLPVWLVMRGVQLLGATTAAQVGMIGPLSTIWLAAWWLHEPITPKLVLGTAVILAGIVLLTMLRPVSAPSGTTNES